MEVAGETLAQMPAAKARPVSSRLTAPGADSVAFEACTGRSIHNVCQLHAALAMRLWVQPVASVTAVPALQHAGPVRMFCVLAIGLDHC